MEKYTCLYEGCKWWIGPCLESEDSYMQVLIVNHMHKHMLELKKRLDIVEKKLNDR